jgi:HEAT repeat protein
MRVTRSFSNVISACSLLSALMSAHVSAEPVAAPGPSLAMVPSGARAPASPAGVSATGARAKAAAASEPVMGPEEHARRLKHALAGLRTSDPVAIADALTSLKELEGRAAAEAIAARVTEGLPPQLTERALEVLAHSQQPVAAPALSELTLHRRWQIRAQAVAALGALRVRSTVSVLLYALDDPSPEVRSAAARALGMAGDPRAIRALEGALARGVDGALEGLAQLVPSKQIDAILARAKVDLVGCEPALWHLLTRTNLPVVTKLKVLSFVQAHDSEQEAAQVMAGWQSKLKERGDARLLAAAAKPAPASKAVAAVSVVPATAAAAQGGK